MGRPWPQTTPNGKQPRRFQAKNPECSMVATRKPWDMSGIKLLQKYKHKLNLVEINVRINTESFCFHLISYLYQWRCMLSFLFILFICNVTTVDILVPNFNRR